MFAQLEFTLLNCTALLNAPDATACCVRMKLKYPPPSAKAQGTMPDTASKASKQAAARGRKTRRNSAIKT